MTAKLKDKKKRRLTDDEIEEFCQSVEQLLTDINERKLARKRKRLKERYEKRLENPLASDEVHDEVEEDVFFSSRN